MYLFLRAVGHQHGHTGKGTGIAGTACDDLEPAMAAVPGMSRQFPAAAAERFLPAVLSLPIPAQRPAAAVCLRVPFPAAASPVRLRMAAELPQALAWEMMPFPVQMPAQCDRVASILPGILPGSFP